MNVYKIHISRFTEENNLIIQLVFITEPEYLMARYLKTFKISEKWNYLFLIVNSLFPTS